MIECLTLSRDFLANQTLSLKPLKQNIPLLQIRDGTFALKEIFPPLCSSINYLKKDLTNLF